MQQRIEINKWRVLEAAEACGFEELQDIAEALGICTSTLSNWFKRGAKVKMRNAEWIAKKFKTTVGEIRRNNEDSTD